MLFQPAVLSVVSPKSQKLPKRRSSGYLQAIRFSPVPLLLCALHCFPVINCKFAAICFFSLAGTDPHNLAEVFASVFLPDKSLPPLAFVCFTPLPSKHRHLTNMCSVPSFKTSRSGQHTCSVFAVKTSTSGQHNL